MSKLSRFIIKEYKKEFSRFKKDPGAGESEFIHSLRNYYFNRSDAEQQTLKNEFEIMLKKRLVEKYENGIGWKKYVGPAGLAASLAGIGAVVGDAILSSNPTPERWQLITGISSVILACYATDYHESHVLKPEKFQQMAEAKLEKKIRRFDASWKASFEKAEPKLYEMLSKHGCYKVIRELREVIAAKAISCQL